MTFQIHISLVNGRPGAVNFSYSQALQVSDIMPGLFFPVYQKKDYGVSSKKRNRSWIVLCAGSNLDNDE